MPWHGAEGFALNNIKQGILLSFGLSLGLIQMSMLYFKHIEIDIQWTRIMMPGGLATIWRRY